MCSDGSHATVAYYLQYSSHFRVDQSRRHIDRFLHLRGRLGLGPADRHLPYLFIELRVPTLGEELIYINLKYLMEVNPKQMKSKDQVESKKKKKNKEKKEKH